MDLDIRKAGPEDIPVIQKIAYTTWPHTFGNILSPDQINYMLEWMYSSSALLKLVTDPDFLFLLAVADRIPCGFASLEFNYNIKKITKIHKLYILPHFQGKGIGYRLIESAEKKSLEKGDNKLTLNVNKYNPAHGFYEKIGFTRIREDVIDIGRGYVMDDYIYEKTLR